MDARWDLVSSRNDFALAGANPVPPDLMTADERQAELGEILAAGLLRLRRRHSSNDYSKLEKNNLDFSPRRSVHATALKRRKSRR